MRKNMKALLMTMLLVAIIFVIAACSSSKESDNQSGEEESGIKDLIVIGTAGSSGTYYAVGAGMSQIINNNSEIDSVSQGTNGAVENMRLLHDEAVDIGFGNWDALYFAYEGIQSFDEKQDVLALMTLYLSGGQMAVKANSGIESYADLKGKSVNLGPKGSTITEMSKIILEYYGVDPETDINPLYLDFAEGGTKLRDNDIDATFYVAGIPTAGLIELSTGTDIKLLSLDDDIAESIVDEYPYYERLVIPAGTYNGVDYDVETLQLWTALAVNKNMSDETAYELVRVLMENVEEFQEVHSVAGDISLENAAKAPIPFHPGAEKYYKEHGVLQD